MTEPVSRLGEALAERYRIERELGQGGMATVYLAQDLRHDRKVAIKVLRPSWPRSSAPSGSSARSRPSPPCSTPTSWASSTSGEVNGTAYYVMPFVEGECLRDRLRREKQLPIADALRLATEVAAALDYAHRHGVIHRDIKPENILLHDGSALVADFGIALAVSSAGGGSRMTETGMCLGTPHYMSPEQAMGEREITARSDVYALGCVTYEMLTGDPPFTGSTAQAIIAKVMTDEAGIGSTASASACPTRSRTPSSPRWRSSRPTGSPRPPSSPRRLNGAPARPADPGRPRPAPARAALALPPSSRGRWGSWAWAPSPAPGSRDTAPPRASPSSSGPSASEAIYNARFAPDGRPSCTARRRRRTPPAVPHPPRLSGAEATSA